MRPPAGEEASSDAILDLRSDTVTQPTPGMRAAMAAAEVGDDVLDGDPSARRLERRVAELLRLEAALFFPTGTQANQTAILLQAEPGGEVVCESRTHLVVYERGGPAELAGIRVRSFASDRGRVTEGDYATALRATQPGSVVWLENTHNLGGGTALPLDRCRAIAALGRDAGLAVHLDGARLWHASVATGSPLPELAACGDTVMVSLSKCLGCPVGSMLAGPRELIERARGVRRALGGGMRQVGVLAAAGLYALDHHLDRIPEDHARARRLAAGLRTLAPPGLEIDEPDTNIVMLRVAPDAGSARSLCAELRSQRIALLPIEPDRIRAVTHRDVDDAGIERAVEAIDRASRLGAGSAG